MVVTEIRDRDYFNSTYIDRVTMAETGTCHVLARTQSDATALKETLHAQQQLLQKLYVELDQEREASATAASEALEMILRLQGEMAAVKMEANHYKRMAEEKIGHAEATLEELEEVIYQKEMEIASLEFQVKAYKQKLLSFRCDFNASEFGIEVPEDQILNNATDQQDEEFCQNNSIRRFQSMPASQFKKSFRVAVRKSERSTSPVLALEAIPPSLDLARKSTEFVSGTLDSYWNQIKMLNERVKVVSDSNEEEKCANLSTISEQREIMPSFIDSDNPPSTPNVHDVFEVPQTSEKNKVNEIGKKWFEKWKSEAENRLRKPDSVSESEGKLNVHREITTRSIRRMTTVVGQRKEGMGVDCNLQEELQKVHQRVERLEREKFSTREEITKEVDGEEQLRLLKHIESQLKLMHLEMKSWKTKKATPNEDVSLAPLQEAMLHFWF
ncbi:hypothetical protein HN51_012379 [Arachis hypogaea]|uniref:uncharacterized protein n=1 Tax=Arachis hypogaea TaxID=3818 RepID=UPI000DEC63A7|nr:uncharacterized protein LOC112790676 isoform X1 [Arachis hypogaea]XP_025688976.1 uncharacterized protein LOC112790676 isoform X1 [Arachis hypogaea]XP_025688977.1 uncharacterized protein LOC112790676 isoform X1 [Arachis hypogaea]XP_025688978.1 uncharacterized protein LOC112790676 isoform X1 [Arachis hypogaea]QHO57853.1 Myosin-binding protein [Arachis hypogaea]QHO57854.1 Myosin-binding protein [Arachis hypogaea]QHO57855.1 Myosin-binding protein [Arachis hypogaea]